MICNIIDKRKRPHRWMRSDAIIEPTWHDNSCPDSDNAEQDDREPGYATLKGRSFAEAIAWATRIAVPVTLYIYDADQQDIPDVPWPDPDLPE